MLEHNSVVWSPASIGDIEEIERVQGNFTKRLKGLHNCSYIERLKRLNLDSLEPRRLHADLIWCYKIIFKLVDIDINDLFVLSNVSSTRGHQYKLYKKHSTGVRVSFFCERFINAWNKLPDDTNFNTLATFKHSIINTDFTGFLKRF